ncbi:MAG: hypothetical protein WDZ60_09765, partial [Wenzhouxiangellaceae bacterium]
LACSYLNESWNQVVREFEAAKAGQPVFQPLCMNAHLALTGQVSDQTTELAATRILLLQAECMSAIEQTDNPPSGAS